MQLDNTLITVRTRTNYDLLDLTVVVCRHFPVRFLALAALGWLPWILIDLVVLYPIIGIDITQSESIMLLDQSSLHLRFLYLTLLLFLLQLPAAMLPLTYFIGQQMFRVLPTWKEILSSYPSLPWLKLFGLGVYRGIIPTTMLIAIATYSGEFQPFLEVFLLPFVVCGIPLLLRALRPFAPEVITLEQGLNRTSNDKTVRGDVSAYRKRMKTLHSLVTSELFMRFVFMAAVGTMMLVLMTCGQLWALQLITVANEWTWFHSLILFPANLFLVSIFVTIFRFVSYIDTRILLEGWEVRLRFMAEADRIRME